MVEEELAPVARTITTRAADGRTMIGHVVLRRDDERVAVWQVSADGLGTGAWVVPVAEAFGARAGELLGCCAQRAVVDVDTGHALDVLAALRAAAGVDAPPPPAVALGEALAEVAEVRRRIDGQVAARREEGRGTNPVEWPQRLPEPPSTLERFQAVARLSRQHPEHRVAGDALLRCALTAWVVARWKETATVVRRRAAYLDVGAPALLPPRWEGALCDAFAAGR